MNAGFAPQKTSVGFSLIPLLLFAALAVCVSCRPDGEADAGSAGEDVEEKSVSPDGGADEDSAGASGDEKPAESSDAGKTASGKNSGPANPPKERVIPRPKFLRFAATYAAAVSKPDAKSALVLSDESAYADIFGTIMPRIVTTNETTSASRKYDLVFLSGRRFNGEAGKYAEKVSPDGVLASVFDSSKLKAGDFKTMLENFPGDDVRLWMFSKSDWMLVGRFGRTKARMSDIAEFFGRDEVASEEADRAGCGSMQDVLAGYVARREELIPVFSGANLNDVIAPQHFMLEKIPPFDWVDPDGLDKDVLESISSLIHDRQYWRRVIVEAEVVSYDKNRVDQAIAMWRDAQKHNPYDTMLRERLYRMGVNAKVFRDFGKFADAANCYEIMLAIRPDDKRVGEEYVALLKQLGKNEFAAEVAKKLKERDNKTTEKKGSRYDAK